MDLPLCQTPSQPWSHIALRSHLQPPYSVQYKNMKKWLRKLIDRVFADFRWSPLDAENNCFFCSIARFIKLSYLHLAGIIFRPLFSTFCSCYMFYTLSQKSHYFFVLSTLLLMFDEFLFWEKFILASTASSCSSLFFIVFNSMHFIALDLSSLFLMWKIIFNHTWHVRAQDVFFNLLENKCLVHSMHVMPLCVSWNSLS